MKEINVEELKKQLVELKIQYAKAKKKAIFLINEMKETQEWKDIQKKRVEIKKNTNELWSKMDKIKKRVQERFISTTHSDGYPYYTRTEYGLETNIYDDVLEAIKVHLRISKLRQSDIEKVVCSLIEVGMSETKHPKLSKEYYALRDEDNKLREHEHELESVQIKKAESEEWEIKRKMDNVKARIKNPNHFKKLSDRGEERLKIEDSDIIYKIYKELED